MKFINSIYLVALALSLAWPLKQYAQEEQLVPIKDNTIFSEGDLSNGAGSFLFVGETLEGNLRRALLQFDFTALQSTSNIQSVSLELNMDKTIVGQKEVFVHKLVTEWGEASSDAVGSEGKGIAADVGDATWNHALFNTSTWNSAGGDFDANASASLMVGGNGLYKWSSPELLQDVQGWIENPDLNHGWILLVNGTGTSAKRFSSREGATPPVLKIVYEGSSSRTELLAESIQLLPNPANELLNIYLHDEQSAPKFAIYNLSGQEMSSLISSSFSQGQLALDVSRLDPGSYILNISLADKVLVERFMIVR